MKYSALLFLGALMLNACQTEDLDVIEETSSINTVTDIQGEYICTGECVETKDGQRSIIEVSGETDLIQHYQGAQQELYQVVITGADFKELEIGALNGLTLSTATAEVSDGHFPVLEEYTFETDSFGKAIGFTKIVRNPNAESFKTCVIYGKKVVK
jgi:hypothetical protein